VRHTHFALLKLPYIKTSILCYVICLVILDVTDISCKTDMSQLNVLNNKFEKAVLPI
jgi:hypothetical protein